MSLRMNIILSIMIAALLPMLVLGLSIHETTTQELEKQYEQRVDDLTAHAFLELEQTRYNLEQKLSVISESADTDFNFEVLEFCDNNKLKNTLKLFEMLNVHGEVFYPVDNDQNLHTQNIKRRFLRSLRDTENGFGLAKLDSQLFLVKVDSITNYFLVGGVPIDNIFLKNLVGNSGLEATIVGNGFALSSSNELEDIFTHAGRNNLSDPGLGVISHEKYLVKSVPFPSFRAAKPPLLAGKLIITQNRSNWFSLVSELTHQIIFTFGIAVLAIFIAGFVISGRVSQPLRDLTLKADKLDLDKLEMHFSESGNKETKALATVLNQMILRLRNSSQTIIEAERRATLGDMARQINHDVRNGFLPIRNVLNHLAQLVDANPDEFVKVFNERKSTLDSGIEYLEELASSYAKVSGKPELEQCNVNQIICDTVDGIKQVEVVTNSESTVIADPMSLRRIIQNLIKNGVQHLPESGGVVTVTTSEKDGSATITVSDNGCGMDQETIDQIFNHFFTTRKEGSGLGLSIVKRLVNDCNGFIKVQSEPGKGSTFTVSIPLPAGENSDG
mgnify:CR=1 FL=1